MQWSLKQLFENTTLIALSLGGGIVIYMVSDSKTQALIGTIGIGGAVKYYQAQFN